MFIEKPVSSKAINHRKLVFGVGINDSEYLVSYINSSGKKIHCPYYVKWHSMVRRCHSDYARGKNESYDECGMCNDWLLFSVFKAWMEKQEWQGKELDKDILFQGNKTYSPITCTFVSSEVNSATCKEKVKNSQLPAGVCAKGNKYQARCSIGKKRVYLGRFLSIEEASYAYITAKTNNIKDIASRQVEPLKSALLSYAKNNFNQGFYT